MTFWASSGENLMSGGVDGFWAKHGWMDVSCAEEPDGPSEQKGPGNLPFWTYAP